MMHSLRISLLSYCLLSESIGVAAGLLPQGLLHKGKGVVDSILPPVTTPGNTTDPLLANSTGGPYTLPQNSQNQAQRKSIVALKQLNFLYGPPVAGGPYYPTGALGELKNAADAANLQVELNPELVNTATDSTLATAGVLNYDGLQTLEDYTKLYDDEWQLVWPTGPDAGVLSNYTQDLLFSMERLSINPYSVRRLNPKSDSLAFQVADNVATKVAGQTLQQLFESGSLFYVDYSDQQNLIPVPLHYSGAVDAYFYIDKATGEFLPLAVHSNIGSKLVYTPADSAEDWLLAKIMYNVDDFWFAQWNHLAATHEVIQIAWMAAIRTLSVDHPVFPILDRVMYEVFAIQPLAQTVLFLPGAAVDQVFAYTGISAQNYSSNRYYNDGAGSFENNYFLTDLQSRGLINSSFGPALQNFPFYEDASQIHSAISSFMTDFVDSYYTSNSVIAADYELQNWVKEAQGIAQAIDFPSISTPADLTNVLTHMAHLASVSHHTINTNELFTISSSLPFHPPALYQPPPTSKGNPNVVNWLPPFTSVVNQFTVGGLFARPLLVGTNRTIIHMFDDQTVLSNMNKQTQNAAATFLQTMTAFSNEVSSRTFNSNGLCQGMPFVWKALDPNVAPYSVST